MDNLWINLGLMAISLLAGFVDSIAGGGGLITMPSLLSAGINSHVVLGTNKMLASFGTTAAALTYIRKGLFKPKFWLMAAMATLMGSVLGAVLAKSLSSASLKKIIPLVIIGIAIYMLIPKSRPKYEGNSVPNSARQGFAGVIMGAYDGFLGPGTGSFWTLIALDFFKQDMVHAAGVARCMNLVSNIAALVTFFYLGMVDWKLGALLGCANMAGGYIGARSAIKYGEKFIRPLFITFVVLIAGRLAYLEYFA